MIERTWRQAERTIRKKADKDFMDTLARLERESGRTIVRNERGHKIRCGCIECARTVTKEINYLIDFITPDNEHKYQYLVLFRANGTHIIRNELDLAYWGDGIYQEPNTGEYFTL